MTGFSIPGGYVPGGAPPGPDRLAGRLTVTDLPDGPADYLVELGSLSPAVTVEPPSAGQPGGLPVGDTARAGAVTSRTATVLRYGLRGWIGEPEDTALPHVPYPARLVAPPSLTRAIPVLPEDGARASYTAGELVLRNGDGALDTVAGDWSLTGRPAVIRRGPYRAPYRAPYAAFGRTAELRIVSAVRSAADRITVALREATADLNVPLTGVFAGTGGLEGVASLAGQARPWLGGTVPNIPAVALLPAEAIYLVGSGAPLASIEAVRDSGAAYTIVGDVADLAALRAAAVPAGGCARCLARGLVRLGSAPTGQVTVDATAGGSLTHGGIALDLLRGPGGLPEDRIDAAGWLTLPPGQAGFYLPRGGTVAEAVEAVVTSCAAWWGGDRLGRVTAGVLPVPEVVTPTLTLRRWMLDGAPEEVAGVAPRWRQRVGYGRLGVVQEASALAGLVAADPAQAALYGTEYRVATAFDADIFAAGGATDAPVLVSGYRYAADAQALADRLLARLSVRRRRYRLTLGRWAHLLDLGDGVAVEHSLLAGGRSWFAVKRDEQGDDGAVEVWG